MVERPPTLSKKDFELFKAYIYEHVGISLGDHKIYLVQARLGKRLKSLGMNSYHDYYLLLANDKSGVELEYLCSLISTNVTSFFREAKQWEFWKEHMKEMVDMQKKSLRIWSAACSSGEEPYSIAMFLEEHLKPIASIDTKILATDVSPKILTEAMRGSYHPKVAETLPRIYLAKYFEEQHDRRLHIKQGIKQSVLFRAFNLVTGDFGLFKQKQFDIIFCRNVMIYFDKPTQQTLVEHFHRLLRPGGYLFIGSSEALTDSGKGFRSQSASIYKKV